MSDSLFDGFLDALHPKYPTENLPGDLDREAIEKILAQFSQFHEARLEAVAAFAGSYGFYCPALDVREVLNWMSRKGISDSDFSKVFRRWRETTAPRTGSVSGGGIGTEDLFLPGEFNMPLIPHLLLGIKDPIENPREDFLSDLEEFEKAIRRVRWETRKSKIGTAWRGGIRSLPQMGIALLVQLFWIFLPWAVLAVIVAMWHSVSAIRGAIFLQFAGMAIGITAGVDLLIWGLVKLSTGGGSAIDSRHEWRVLTRNGRPGARVGPATMKDLYEHTHGHGSWDRRNSRRSATGAVLAVVVFFVCPLLEIPFLEEAGIQGLSPIVGYFLIYPLLPLAVIGGLIYWLSKLSPPVNLR
ncbi:MAG: hypothetical protein ABSF23_04570 [Terracidiphilus sp.]